MRTTRSLVVVMCALGARAAFAAPPPARPDRHTPPTQPAPAQPATNDKVDAKALMQSGLKLFAAKDFLGALAVFKTAYTRFPSAKILLNIGTTLTKLGRKAEAANAYQHYLDSPDADRAKQNEVKKVLAELDAAVAILELSVTPVDAEIQINDEDWLPAGGVPRHRVAVGSATVRARHPAYKPDERVVHPTAGAKLPVAIALIEIPVPVAPAVAADAGLRAAANSVPPRSRVGVMVLAHVDIANGGGAGLFGATVDVTSRLQAQAAAILGPSYGGYAGASFAILGDQLRPVVSAGLPIFVSHGARVAARAAVGVELALNRHLALIAELGVEYLVNPEADVKHTLVIPAIGAAGRL